MELIGLAFTLLPVLAVWGAVRYGPWHNRWWRRETALGFMCFVGGLSFLAGFVGPILLTPGANQGPLLGIFITGPAGFVIGLIWGLLRAARRNGEAQT